MRFDVGYAVPQSVLAARIGCASVIWSSTLVLGALAGMMLADLAGLSKALGLLTLPLFGGPLALAEQTH